MQPALLIVDMQRGAFDGVRTAPLVAEKGARVVSSTVLIAEWSRSG